MSEETLIHFCSPTLAGIKAGNLFTSRFENREEMRREVRRYNNLLVPKGLCMIPMRYEKGVALLYLYRRGVLEKELMGREASGILKEAGYESKELNSALKCLITRIRSHKGFPHEIGLFLSYPPEDVRGFIENRASDYKTSGIWKVYGDAEKAEETFRRYKRCEASYKRSFQRGISLEKLIV